MELVFEDAVGEEAGSELEVALDHLIPIGLIAQESLGSFDDVVGDESVHGDDVEAFGLDVGAVDRVAVGHNGSFVEDGFEAYGVYHLVCSAKLLRDADNVQDEPLTDVSDNIGGYAGGLDEY